MKCLFTRAAWERLGFEGVRLLSAAAGRVKEQEQGYFAEGLLQVHEQSCGSQSWFGAQQPAAGHASC